MRIAIPVANGILNLHFGHCDSFVIVDVEEKKIVKRFEVPAPKHEPGVLPRFLAQQGVNLIIAGGMGVQAQNLFNGHNIEVVVGASPKKPEELVEEYLNGSLVVGDNVCGH